MVEKRRCIRSMRIAGELMAAGFPIVDTEASRGKAGLLVWIFDNTPEFDAKLSEIMGGKPTTRQRE